MIYTDSGIYQIKCLKNNKIYVGETTSFTDRIKGHLYQLENNRHCNRDLQEDFSLFGNDSFEFSVIERLSGEKSELMAREWEHIKMFLENGETLYNSVTYRTKSDINRDFTISPPIGEIILTEEELGIIFQYKLSGAEIRAFIYMKLNNSTNLPDSALSEVGIHRKSFFRVRKKLRETTILKSLGG